MNFISFYSFIFSFICLSGFVFQLQQVSDLYFQFLTSSKIAYRMEEIEPYQSIMFCTAYFPVLDRSRYKEYGITLSVPQTLLEQFEEMSKLTIKNILTLTPAVTDVLDDCTRRDDEFSVPLLLKRSECYNFFEIIKSVNGERICYTFRPRLPTNYSFGEVASSQTQLSLIYQLNMLPSLARSIVGHFISYGVNYEKHEDPLNSRFYHAKVYNTKSFNQSRFSIYGEYIFITRLPVPYDTKCVQGHDSEDCNEKCLIRKFKSINKIPWSGFHSEKLDMKMFNVADLKNNSLAPIASASFRDCHSSCKTKIQCFTSMSKTTAYEFQYQAPVCSFAIQATTPSAPHMHVSAVPFLNLIEYIVQIGSCFGVWFGLSIISINPLKWKFFNRKTSSEIQATNAHRRNLFTKVASVLSKQNH